MTHALLLSELERFHREVFLPDFERVVERLITPRFDEMRGHFDAIDHRLDKLGERRGS